MNFPVVQVYYVVSSSNVRKSLVYNQSSQTSELISTGKATAVTVPISNLTRLPDRTSNTLVP
jgi:hypothetical protein